MRFTSEDYFPLRQHRNYVTLVNDYLSKKAPLVSRHGQNVHWNDYLDGDFWGNPYRCVLRESTVPDDPANSAVARLHFYSCGQDGISRSDGNDEDDINSWDDHSQPFYTAESRRQEAERLAFEALCYAPWFLGLLIAAWLFVRSLGKPVLPRDAPMNEWRKEINDR